MFKVLKKYLSIAVGSAFCFVIIATGEPVQANGKTVFTGTSFVSPCSVEYKTESLAHHIRSEQDNVFIKLPSEPGGKSLFSKLTLHVTCERNYDQRERSL